MDASFGVVTAAVMTVGLPPDPLWKLIEPFLAVPPPRLNGGRPRVPDRACLTAVAVGRRADVRLAESVSTSPRPLR